MLSKNKQPFRNETAHSYVKTAQKINIAVICEDLDFRREVAKLMDDFKEIEITFSTTDVVDFRQKVKKNNHVLITLMDINMSVMDCFNLSRWITINNPNMCIMILGLFMEGQKALIKILESESNGFVLKEITPTALINAIKSLLSKQLYLNHQRSLAMGIPASEEKLLKLRDRDLLFLQLCCQELNYKTIAFMLNMSYRTIDNYSKNIFKKLGVKTRVGSVVYCIKHGLVTIL